jgi:hypothetical protein
MEAPKPRRSFLSFIGALALVGAAGSLTSCVTSAPIGKPVAIAASDEVRASFRNARTLLVYEGLPHQAHEKALLAQELQRSDVTRIADYPFYAPAVAARQPESLRRILGNAASFRVYSGPKTCGGFHPDYAVAWSDRGSTHHLLVCYGCGEVLLLSGGQSLAYNLTDQAVADLQQAFAPHARKRPR